MGTDVTDPGHAATHLLLDAADVLYLFGDGDAFDSQIGLAVGGRREPVAELSRNSRTTDHNVTLVILDLDPETGGGTGTVIGGTELSIDKETGQLHIEAAGHRSTELKKVKSVKK